MILLYLYMAIVAAVMLCAGLVEYQGLRGEVAGANGFLWTMALLMLATGLVPTVLVAWIVWDGHSAVVTLLGGVGWLALMGYASLKVMMAGARKR